MNKHINHTDKNFSTMIDNFWIDLKLDVHKLDHDFTCSEIIKAVQNLKRNKAPGIDGVRTEMLKCGIHGLALVLTKRFNCIYQTGWRLKCYSQILCGGSSENSRFWLFCIDLVAN